MTPRRNIMLGTAGHVDHGKSALVKLLTGCETDTLAEEKQRGLTIDLGFAPCRLADNRVVGIVDVPGHVDFIRNMVAGAHGIDVVILVVAADDGIMPQTHEHLHILTLMGLKHGLVALTKTDLVDKSRLDFVVEDLRHLLAGTFLAKAAICPVSNVTGDGYENFFDSMNRVVDACESRSGEGLFRMWVEDAFTIRGAGTVVTGIPTHGQVRPGDRLHLLPRKLTSPVRSLQVYGEQAGEGRSGECVALSVPELDHSDVRRGMILCESDRAEPVEMFEGQLRILESIKTTIEDYLETHLHVGTAAVTARVAMLESTGMTAGQKQFVQIRASQPIPVVPGERFVIRANVPGDSGPGLATIGGGIILGASNTRLRRKKQWTLDLLSNRCSTIANPVQWCEQMLDEADAPVRLRELEEKCFARAGELTARLEALLSSGKIVSTADGKWIHQNAVGRTSARAMEALQSFHVANPQRAGVGRDELASNLKTNPEILDLAIEALLRNRQCELNGPLVARVGWNARLSTADQRLCDQIAARIEASAFTPPTNEELAAALNQTPQQIAAMTRLLAERGCFIRLDERLCMHRDAVEAGKMAALKLFRQAPSFSTMDFRDALGISRKYAVPLIDYLDKIRFTVRAGNTRTPGVEARKHLSTAASRAQSGPG